ncbi:MAG: hypothetical protein AAGG38_02180 [Planctomycetota bacterium]
MTENTPFSRVPPGYSPGALNVRPFDAADERLRGGQRPGTGLYLNDAVQADTPIQRLIQGDVPSVPVFVAGDFNENFAVGGSGNLTTVFPSWSEFDLDYSNASLSAGFLNFTNDTGSGLDLWDDNVGNFGTILALRPTTGTDPAAAWTMTMPITFDPSEPIDGNSSGDAAFQLFIGGQARNNAGSLEGIGVFLTHDVDGPIQPGLVFLTPCAAGAANVQSLPLQAVSGSDSTVAARDAVSWTFTLSFDGTNEYTATLSGGGLASTISLTFNRSDFSGVGSTDYTNSANDGLFIGARDIFDLADGTLLHVGSMTYGPGDPGGFTTRSTYLVAVAGGDVYRSDTPPSAMTASTGGANALDTSTFLITAVAAAPSPSDSAPTNTQRHIYFADGTNYQRLNLSTNTVSTWAAVTGTLPTDGAGNVARIGALYRNRLVLAGLPEDPQNWSMSRSGDALDYDFSPAVTSALQAVAGNNTDAGLVADRITALIPYSDDTLIFGGDRTIWRMTGDPAEGGRLDAISYDIGIVGPDAFARDPFGNIYFMGTNGLNRMSPGSGAPELVSSGKLDKTFSNINLVLTRVLLAWNRDRQGLHIFFSLYTEPAAAPIHYWYDQRTDSLWPEQYPISNGPTAVAVFDGDAPADRALVLGGLDGYLRNQSNARTVDADGTADTAIESYVDIGPFAPSGTGKRSLLSAMQFTLGDESGDGTVEVYAEPTAEQTVEATVPRVTRTISGGIGRWIRHRVGDAYFRFRLRNTGTTSWSYEAELAEFRGAGRQRAGGR